LAAAHKWWCLSDWHHSTAWRAKLYVQVVDMGRMYWFCTDPVQIFERTAPPPLPHHTHHPTTPMHHSPSPFHTAHLKPSHNGSVSIFFDSGPLPTSRFVSARPHHHHHIVRTTPPPLCTIPHCRFTRRTLNRAATARFWVLAWTPSLPCVSWAHGPTTTATSSTPPLCTIPFAVSCGAPKIEPQWLSFGFLPFT
jgi:hypothetical protein